MPFTTLHERSSKPTPNFQPLGGTSTGPVAAPEQGPGFLTQVRGFARDVFQDIGKAVATPSIRFSQAVASGAGALSGDRRLQEEAAKPITLPSYIGGGTVNPIGSGFQAAPQVASDSLRFAANTFPFTRLGSMAASLGRGAISRFALEGAATGGVAGLLQGAGDELAETSFTPLSVAGRAATTGLFGSIFGGIFSGTLGAFGSRLSSQAARRLETRVAEEVETALPQNVTPVDYVMERSGVPITSDDLQPLSVGRVVDVANNSPESSAVFIDRYLDNLPTIQMGSKAKVADDGLPTIKFGRSDSPTPPGYRYEPIRPEMEAAEAPVRRASTRTEASAPVREDPTQVTVERIRLPRTETVTPEEVPGTGETRVRGLASSVEAKAVENNIRADFGDLPQYQRVSMKEQAQEAAKLVSSDYQKAREMALGNLTPPPGVLPESIFVAVENKAITEGDIDTLRALALNSRLVREATTMGQRLRTLAERNSDSPVAAITEIRNTRQRVAERRGNTPEKTMADMADSVRKAAPKKEDWATFINSIKC